MVESLKECLENNGYYEEMPLSSFTKAPCDDCDHPGLDFNDIATKFYQEIREPKPPTVNALFFDSDNDLYFIEMNQYYASMEQFAEEFFQEDGGDSVNAKISGTIDTIIKIVERGRIVTRGLLKLYQVMTERILKPLY